MPNKKQPEGRPAFPEKNGKSETGSLFRFPLSAFRFPLSDFRLPTSAFRPPHLFFAGFAFVVLGCLFAGIATGQYYLAGLPALLLVAYLTLVDFRLVFFLLMACVPLSTEVYLPNGFATDLPTEPLIVGLMLVALLYAAYRGPDLGTHFLRHPITVLLLLHFGWIAVTTLTSGEPFVSVKFLLAKTWYIATFYFLAGWLLRGEADLRRLFWFLYWPLTATVLITMARHSASGFSFEEIHRVLHPFYRNHVAYAAILVSFFPFLCIVRNGYDRGSFRRRLLTASLGLYLVAIYLSYTRAAYVALLIAGGAYLVIRWRLTRYVFVAALAAALAVTAFLAYQNRYLDYAPNYARTVTHRDFNNLLEATYRGEDISTMERVYRWVAGMYMTRERPLTGFGPGTFYFFYKPYTVTSFRTYVSDNPERSGIHNYYLMLAVEQGIPGLFLFMLLCGYALIRGETIYHRSAGETRRPMALIALLMLIVILSLLIINDLIETDKIGPFFFLSLALLVNLDRPAEIPAHD